jgi:predicted nucleic acid-binding protein
MTRVIVLDSGPLGLLMHTKRTKEGVACRTWLARQLAAGVRVVVPGIVDYELRRELIRGKLSAAVGALDAFNAADPGRFLILTSADLRLAAELWAQLRNQGQPTADRHALDIDVILSAQALGGGWPTADLIVATSNVGHLSRLVRAELWQNI